MIRRAFTGFCVFLVLVACVLVFGPREGLDAAPEIDREAISEDVARYIAESEAGFSDIREGLEKEIIWHDGTRKTAVSIIYIHGFSASKEEVRPVPDLVANALEANLFFTRKRGHGRTSDAMAEARATDWLKDVAEALAVGEALGEEVILIATSNGGADVTYLLGKNPELFSKVKGLVLISPNYGVAQSTGVLLDLAFARSYVPLILGRYFGGGREDPRARHAWTTPYATASLVSMARIANAAFEVETDKIMLPAFFIYSLSDNVVSPERIEQVIENWAGPKQVITVETPQERSQHVITGEIRNPQTVEMVAEAIIDWACSLL